MDAILDIYKKTIQPSETNMHRDKVYVKAKNRAKQYYEILCKRLSENDKAILDKLISCYGTQTERKNGYCFKDGFKKGVSVAIKSLE